MSIPRGAIITKDEFKSPEAHLLDRQQAELIGPRHLVSCPKKSFEPVCTEACAECGFWLGFFPADRRKPLGPGNAWSVCTHPMGRQVFSV